MNFLHNETIVTQWMPLVSERTYINQGPQIP